ncbi:MAG: RNA-binding protein [Microcystis sp. LE19-84.1B]|uniref:RNA-binding protein n=1 Tax=Microcystis sp. LE19-84.1B TaxID=3016438 RepID=UPI0022BFBE7B|nr:RNA-binding protein [Microcystis sp. LE19-84.1B]MCZ8223696.1 RNA-binding protein [Microcystis sp. LE19-84.1B]
MRNPARERSRNPNREVWESPSVYGGEDVKGFLTTILLASSPAAAWFHARGGSWSASGFRGTASGDDGSWSASGYRGGSASGGDGSWSGTGFRGTTASGDDGSWDVNGYRGGSASGGDGSWSGTTPYGTSVYGYHGTYYGGTYATYHPPTVVNSYYGAGCYNCGGWAAAGAAATTGVALGATAATANQAESYNAGFAAGSAYALGAIYTNLPGGCVYNPVGTSTYYRCGTAWLSPAYGAKGVYYRVVTAPF